MKIREEDSKSADRKDLDGISDATDIAKAVSCGSVAFVIAGRWVVGAKAFPVSNYFLEFFYEELFYGTEKHVPTSNEKVMRARGI